MRLLVPMAKTIEIGAGIPGIIAFAILLILNWQSLFGSAFYTCSAEQLIPGEPAHI